MYPEAMGKGMTKYVAMNVMAAKRAKVLKFITGRIHTARDTVADSENVYFLTDRAKRFVEKL